MKKIRNISIILLTIILIGCSNLSVNTDQVNSTLKNIECYKSLLNEITNQKQTKFKLLQIRDSKKRGKDDPVTVKNNFRTIDNNELQEIVSTNWKVNCSEKINKVNDLTGIRYVNDSIVIIEIDKLKHHTLNEQYSSGGTMEIHRLVIAGKPPVGKNYKYGTETIVWTKYLGANWTYEVSHYRTFH